MNDETILKLMTNLKKNNIDNEHITQALLPGLFRATIVKLNDKNNNHNENNSNDRRRKRQIDINSQYGMKQLSNPGCDREKIHLRSPNLSIGDLLLIVNDNHETLSHHQTHSRICPAYRFCVERKIAAGMVPSMDQDNDIFNNELPTLRNFLEPIKQTALRMKRLSQLKDEIPHTERVCQLTQTNDFRDPEGASTNCQLCDMKLNEFKLNSIDSEMPRKDHFEKGDKMDDKIFVRIISRPEIETQQDIDNPLLSVIQQIVSNMQEVSHERMEYQEKEVPLCKNTKKVCLLCPGCLKPLSTTNIDEHKEVKDRGIQSQGSFSQEPTIFDDNFDEQSIRSYEFVKTMDVGCDCKVDRKNDEISISAINNQHCIGEYDYPNGSLDPLLFNILTMLTNNQEIQDLNIIDPIDTIKPKSSESQDPVSEVSSEKDKSIGCTCVSSYDFDGRSANEIEIKNELTFKSSYIVENFHVETDSKKDVATSTYSISLSEKRISTLEIKSKKVRSQKSSSTQYDNGPESIWKIPSNTIENRTKPIFDSRKTPLTKEQDPAKIIEEPCPCGCGYFLEGDSTCTCGCAQYTDSPCVVPNNLETEKHTRNCRIRSSNDSKTPSQDKSNRNTVQSEESIHENNCQFCSCKGSSNIEPIPMDPILKRMNDNIIEIQNSELNSHKTIEINCKHLNDNRQHDLVEEARKLQEKIECYRKENEYFRKLIKEACSRCQNNAEVLSRPPPIRATYSGLANAIEILQAKCRSKDSMIAILAEGLHGVINYAQIAKNLAAPCLEYSYWDFDRSALYTYLCKTMSKLSLKESKNSCSDSNGTTKESDKNLANSCCNDSVPPPSNFKVVRELCRCLLLSWKIPKNLKNVDGYRIYVNGNLATNLRSPTRTETILGFVDYSKPVELKLHSFNKNGILSDPVTITYYSNNENNYSNN